MNKSKQSQIAVFFIILSALFINACKKDTLVPPKQKLCLSKIQSSYNSATINYDEKGSVINIDFGFGKTLVEHTDENENPLELRYVSAGNTSASQKKLFEYDTKQRIIKESLYSLWPPNDTTHPIVFTTYTYFADSVVETRYDIQNSTPITHVLTTQRRKSVDIYDNITSNSHYYTDNFGWNSFEKATLLHDNAYKSPLSLVKKALVIRNLEVVAFPLFWHFNSQSPWIPKEIQIVRENYSPYHNSMISGSQKIQIQIVPGSIIEDYPTAYYVRSKGESIVQRTGEKISDETIDSVKFIYKKMR